MITIPGLTRDIEAALERHLPRCAPASAAGTLNQALRYSLFPGGKRMRPVMTVLAARVVGAEGDAVFSAACAVEFVHTSSIIIDDLPCMDDAELRRGIPALHRAYGEETALLAALALLNQAYALFGHRPELIREATACIGVEGMIGGQATDLSSCPDSTLFEDRNRKTSALMRLVLTAGALSAGAPPEAVAPLASAGLDLGHAYQICDDLLDSGPGSHSSGKDAGQDLRHGRPNHSVVSSPEICLAQVGELVESARRSLLRAYGPGEAVDSLLGYMNQVFASVNRSRS